LLVSCEVKLARGLAQGGIKFIKRDVRVEILQHIMNQTACGLNRLAFHCDRGELGKIQWDKSIAEVKKQSFITRHDVIHYQPSVSLRQVNLCFSKADISSILFFPPARL